MTSLSKLNDFTKQIKWLHQANWMTSLSKLNDFTKQIEWLH